MADDPVTLTPVDPNPAAPTGRWVLGPRFDYDAAPELPPAPASVTAKRDVVVSFGGIRDGKALINVPAYDPAEFNVLGKVRCYLLPSGSPLPGSAYELLSSVTPFGETAAEQPVTKVPLPDVPKADAAGNGLKYLGVTALWFET